MTRALLVHSPLVGPATVRALAAALDEHGWTSVVPDLRRSLASTDDFARDAGAAGKCDVVIGHSGAGAVLPVVAGYVGSEATVFVDAVVPTEGEAFRPTATFVELLDTIPTDDGLLAPWHEWWPAGTVERLVPDETVRGAIVGEIPRVPRRFYDDEIALPPRWWTEPAAYLRLSAAYDDELARATGWGWPTLSIDGHHLELVTRPHAVAAAVRQLVSTLVG